jgi:RNA polymerase sigma-70 factor (ECF subfamily)
MTGVDRYVTQLKQSAEPGIGIDRDTPDGFTAWVKPHWSAMARLAARSGFDADDILQDALADAWRKRGQFDPERGGARSWLLAITADQRSKTWRRAARLLGRVTVLPDDGGPATFPGDTSASVDLERALARLTARQRLAIDLHYYLGLGVADMAVVMRCSEGTVKSTLSDARARLRRHLGEDYR